MKSRLTLIFAALVVLLGSMVWLVQDRVALAEAPVGAPVPLMAATPPAAVVAVPVPSGVAQQAAGWVSDPGAVPASAPRAPAVGTTAAREGKSVPTVGIDESGAVTYVARDGDTVSDLANALRGGGSRDDRDAVIAANASLRADPDRVLTGQTYSLDVPAAGVAGDPKATAASEPPTAVDVATDAPRVDRASEAEAQRKVAVVARGPRLTYTAQVGDTVRVLAAELLGGDTEANRNAIIGGNASLRQDPHHLVAGRRYTIVARDGLAADRGAPAQMDGHASQPDADDVLRAGRKLGYTARAGDTVSKLAAKLLGSDTPLNRQAIINDNPDLKQDPDRLVVGQTYWITAPTVNSVP